MNAADENAINNSGTINRNGFFQCKQHNRLCHKNNGTFNNNGDMFVNAFGLPGWFIENISGGVFTNNSPHNLAFPIPGSFYNVSEKSLLNHNGSTFHNYGTLKFFGHRISGTGAFINHAGSFIDGCNPLSGSP